MKKIYFLTLTFGLIFFGLNSANAQDFPWPDLGEAMIIEPGAPGTINETIHADTSATGERLHNHYILRRGQTYLYTARIQNTGYPLMVTAEDGDGELPIIKALGPAEGEDEAERPFHAEGDLYLKDITINGFDQGGNYTDNATVRLAADGITVVLKGVNLDFNRQNSIRINAVDCELYVEDCVIGNQGVAARLWQGFAVHFRGNWTPLVHMRNNTIYNMHNNIISNRNEKRYGKLVFENNTVMNTGTNGADFGRPDELVVKNNLFVNVGILGDGFLGDRETFVEPWYYFAVDSNFTDTTNTTLLDPVVDFSNNRFYLDPAVAELLPDSSDKSTETLIHPYLLSLIDEATNIIADEAFSFTNFPATTGEYESYINDFFAFSDDPAEMPQFDTDIRTLDFGYPETHAAYTAGTDGGPIGDLNWLGGAVGINDYRYEAFNVYPNPVSGVIKVNLKKDQNIDKVVITNILGQDVKVVSSINSKQFEIDARELNTGIYFVNFYKNERFLGTNKILKK
ncbi:MAG: T9SS type A sorting domain-containing protein [Bacteroidota bacterium]